MIRSISRSLVASIVSVGLVVAAAPPGAAGHRSDPGIVDNVINAPVTPAGDVAGRETDLVINLDTSLDPAVPGRSLRAGDAIKVRLPSAFVNEGLPVANPGPAGCVPSAFDCSTAVLLQGWPQNPIPPAPSNYTVSLQGTHTIVFRATRDLLAGDPTLGGPGIKQMHLILNGFTNPRPGRYAIKVKAQTGPGGSVERGIGLARIRPRPRASLNVTSVFAAGANTIYQQTSPGSATPHAWDFLVWDKRGRPAVGVTVHQINARRAVLRDGRRVVGRIFIRAPRGATGQSVTGGPSTLLSPSPLLGLESGRLTVLFTAGSAPGKYVTTLSMNRGNRVRMHVEVVD